MVKARTVAVALAVLIVLELPVVAAAQSSNIDDWGQWTNGTQTHAISDTPTAVDLDASQIQASNGDTFAVVGGTEYAWGYGTDGDLGDGTTSSSFYSPVKVDFPSGTTIAAIGDAKNAGFAVDSSDRGWSWGESTDGEICTTGRNRKTPELLHGLPAVTAVAGGQEHVLWLTETGTVEACGLNTYGQLGDGTTERSDTPVAVQGLPDNDPVIAISAGNWSSAALTASGRLYMWGNNAAGQLGIGSTATFEDTAMQVPGTFSAVYAGGSLQSNNPHTLAITAGATPTIESWGANTYGELGTGYTSADSDSPVDVQVPPGVVFVTVMAGGSESGAIDSQGDVWMWGQGAAGQLGNGGTSKKLTPVEVGSGFVALSGTANNVVALEG